MMKIREWLNAAESYLFDRGIKNSCVEIQMLVAHVMDKDRSWVLAHMDDPIDPACLASLLERRATHEPLAYILGWREFYGRRFSVDSSVLIPRHETETLITAILSSLGNKNAKEAFKKDSLQLLDIGTGSGCLSITLNLENPCFRVTAVDISEAALKIAKKNANDFQAQIEFLHSDLFENISTDCKFDYIVSNPPYIEEQYVLEPQIKDHEPPIALFSGIDGLDFYRRLASEGKEFLTSEGSCFVEIGFGQQEKIKEIFQSKGWELLNYWFDLFGIVRVLCFKIA